MKTEQKPNRTLHIATEVFRWLSSAYYFPGVVTDVIEPTTTVATKKTETDETSNILENSKKE